MKEKIIEIMTRHNENYWNNDSWSDSPELSQQEKDAIDRCNEDIAKEIIELFR